ncbi:MAG: phytoene/squalene synthase family protein [Bacilli bacterium]
MNSRLQEAYHYCENVIRQHSESFYRAFSLLPTEKRNGVWAVYAFCRTVDDIVDEGAEPETELARFEQQFYAYILERQATNELPWLALQHTFATFGCDPAPFLHMIHGQRMDLTKVRYETVGELYNYSYHVASTVGLMLLPILAGDNAGRLRYGGIALGQAMQITNILRDIGEDYRRGRIYLPVELMQKYGVTEANLAHGEITPGFVRLWEHLAEESEALYDTFFETYKLYPRGARVAVGGAAVFYRDILRTIRGADYTVFHQKHFVSRERKKVLLAGLAQ